MGKFLVLICGVIVLVLLAIWSPWLRWNINLASFFGVSRPESISGLVVNSLAGEIEVFIDSNSVGKVTPETSPFIVDRVKPGDRLVTLKRVGEFADLYASLNRLIEFQENSSVVISYNLGPEEIFSEGHIIYTRKKPQPEERSKLTVRVNQQDFNFGYDSLPFEKVSTNSTNVDLDFSAQRQIRINKTGFEALNFTILPEQQSDRDLLKDFDLIVDVQLMLQPVEVNNI